MNKTVLKGFGVSAAAVVAVGVCVVGYKVNDQRQQEQRVTFAQTSIESEQAKLKEMEATVAGMFDKDKGYLKSNLTNEMINQAKMKLEDIRATAEDFKLKEKSAPEAIKLLTERKTKVSKQLTEVSTKFKAQTTIKDLFTSDIKDWQKVDKELTIKDTAKEKSVTDVQKSIEKLAEDDWTKQMAKFLKVATDQLNEVKQLEDQIAEYQTLGSLTQADYDTLLANIENVRNEKLRAKLQDSANVLADYIYVEEVAPEQTEDTVDETDGFDETDDEGDADFTDDGSDYYDDSNDTNDGWVNPTPPTDNNSGNTGGQAPIETPQPDTGNGNGEDTSQPQPDEGDGDSDGSDSSQPDESDGGDQPEPDESDGNGDVTAPTDSTEAPADTQ